MSTPSPHGNGLHGCMQNSGWELIDGNGAAPRPTRHDGLPLVGGGDRSMGASRPHHDPL